MRYFSSLRQTQCVQISCSALVIAVTRTSLHILAQAQGQDHPVEHATFYRTMQIDGLSIFYREAGPKDAPTILLLHGFPSSSRMFEPLFAQPHLIGLALATATGRTRNNSHIRSITS